MAYLCFIHIRLGVLSAAVIAAGLGCSPASSGGGDAGSSVGASGGVGGTAGGNAGSAGAGGAAGTSGGAAGTGATGGLGGSGASGGGGAGGSTGGAGGQGGTGGAGAGGDTGGAGAGGSSGGMGGSSGGGSGGDGGSGGGGTHPCTPGGSGFDTDTAGVAIDKKTCLEWQREAPPKQPGNCMMSTDNPEGLCWVQAGLDCKALGLDGHSDWRLPTVEELTSIVIAANYPAIDQTVFPGTELSMYWTSEAHDTKATCLDFSNAGMVNMAIGQTGGQAYRCVRGPVGP